MLSLPLPLSVLVFAFSSLLVLALALVVCMENHVGFPAFVQRGALGVSMNVDLLAWLGPVVGRVILIFAGAYQHYCWGSGK
jgi:hypothetical protein